MGARVSLHRPPKKGTFEAPEILTSALMSAWEPQAVVECKDKFLDNFFTWATEAPGHVGPAERTLQAVIKDHIKDVDVPSYKFIIIVIICNNTI